MAISTIGNSGNAPLPAAPQAQPAAPVAARAPAAVPEPAPQPQQNAAQTQRAVEALRKMIDSAAPNSLSFSIDDSTGKTIVRVTDVRTGEMIRQIPSEELLAIARSLDRMQGMLLQQKA